MKRLTRRDGIASWSRVLVEFERIGEIIRRLCSIEDILGDEYDLDRLKELVEADKDGRCVVLPVKPGTQIWSTIFCSIDDNGIEHPTFPWEFKASMIDEWGIGWHLTEADANAALKGDSHE